MALTPSTMAPLGMQAPDFVLVEPASGRRLSPVDFSEAPGLLVVFLSNHCPFVKHVADALADFVREYQEKGLAILAVNSNDVEAYPDDSPENMVKEVEYRGYAFPYLFDETQEVARAYHAACTPDFFLFDGDRKLVYRGQFDASRPGNDEPITGADLRAACDAVLAGKVPSATQHPSAGCNIKWRAGNEPEWFG